MLLKAIEERLSNPRFLVLSAVDFAVLDKHPPPRDRCIYVLPLGEKVNNTEFTGSTVSLVRYQIGIVLALRSARDVYGNEHQKQIDSERKLLREQLAGWVPDDKYSPLTRGDGHLLKFKQHTVYWLDTYYTEKREMAAHF